MGIWQNRFFTAGKNSASRHFIHTMASRRGGVSTGFTCVQTMFIAMVFLPTLIFCVAFFHPLFNFGFMSNAGALNLSRAVQEQGGFFITPEQYQSLMTAKSPSIMVYFASWCPHCQHFVPQFIDIARTYSVVAASNNGKKTIKEDVTFGAIDCVKLRSFCEEAKIDMYPTIVARNIPSGIIDLILHYEFWN
jgi:thiol-disulfide isomerase/thioredoxin